MWLLFCVVLVFLTAYWFLVATRLPKDFPPGPRFTLPVLGNALQLGWRMQTGIDRLAAKYGDICGFYLGGHRAVVISDYRLLQEIGSKAAFQYRIDSNSANKLLRGGLVKSGDGLTSPGIFVSNGPAWTEQRRFSLHQMRDLGFGKRSMEADILMEVQDLCDFLDENGRKKSIDVKFGFTAAVINSFWTMVSGKRFSYDDDKIIWLTRIITGAFQQQSISILNHQVINFYKYIRMFFIKFGIGKGPKLMRTMYCLMDQVVTDHEMTLEEESPRDFTDCYLLHAKNTLDSNSSFYGTNGRLSLVNILTDFFLAGTESTSTTLTWGMLYMILHPDIQTKVQDELDKVTGGSRLPNLGDRASTPYTEATIHEIQRLADIIPVAFSHCLNDDVELAGYFLPKGTVIMPNLSGVHKNPATFPDPEKFDPSRYIDKDGKFQPHPKIIPFGIGKRKCLGEPLARMSLYLFFSGILNRFTICAGKEAGKPSTERVYGLSTSPKPFKIQFKLRKASIS